MKIFEKFNSDQSGNVSVMFAVSLLAIVAATGVAIDYGQLIKKQDKLQNQVDAAVLAAVTLSVDAWDMSRADEQAARKARCVRGLEKQWL